uniref:Uncharacterized protein n=1 Tax=Candidatus Kentrum sp. SD TaxID=2126332 RepID=A0A451BJ52_9GAMM|nr:MAG: hypothetical protein BECKSD772F_GA0070984_101036 [Candidatus Kentron sp. SD]VFK41203.1 MAG: hypothetical protein BECKSD772E_GA0070983_101034 [Candidatus Kentron sp. SD]VFK78299.1 MAG: hypothetical protein BECKSD772D_GA0070982_101130 [Candidatus Kentron sp. SD]
MNDPIVEEVRRIRDEHSRQFNYDLDAICEDYKAHQIQAGNRLVRLEPKLRGPAAWQQALENKSASGPFHLNLSVNRSRSS